MPKQEHEELLELLWVETVKEILRRVKDQTASPTDISNALKLLRDNGITLDLSKGDALDFLKDIKLDEGDFDTALNQ